MTTINPVPQGRHDHLRAALAYPLGPLSGLVMLLCSRRSREVRFHAWQAIIGSLVIGGIGNMIIMSATAKPLAGLLETIWLAVLIGYLVYAAYCVLNGRGFRIPVIGGFVEKRLVK